MPCDTLRYAEWINKYSHLCVDFVTLNEMILVVSQHRLSRKILHFLNEILISLLRIQASIKASFYFYFTWDFIYVNRKNSHGHSTEHRISLGYNTWIKCHIDYNCDKWGISSSKFVITFPTQYCSEPSYTCIYLRFTIAALKHSYVDAVPGKRVCDASIFCWAYYWLYPDTL